MCALGIHLITTIDTKIPHVQNQVRNSQNIYEREPDFSQVNSTIHLSFIQTPIRNTRPSRNEKCFSTGWTESGQVFFRYDTAFLVI